ncbi:bifunctional 2-polyprenyl-6-hydroxyphenol methylase/3-demethylubiquinol 3-O-methyltransferase UbiG [Nostoc sp. FACHB-190]|uniref:class I SAM-dependent methyltransferase n=1 Tax=Nostoc sp. FACHB-190 TaxID=2692838 RepID=UPI0016853220|nr:class I SAM-dependent methyltransferase [Nostoc sp. FACHB-190]MBD2298138.1 class I SAM-dependent methyltransferase [Nostoc sp. FACHB-190]
MYLVENVANYNPIASVYSSFAKERELEILVLENLILQNLTPGAHILDIGCANGRTVSQLSSRGYQTTGIDISEELLRIAQTNSPESKFILGDIRKLELQPTYDAVVSIDVFGHILNLEELTNVFQKVYAALHNNGIFAFTTPVADEIWDKTSPSDFERFNKIDASDKYVYFERYYIYNQEERIREVKFTGFELINAVWQRSDSDMLVKDYLASEIKSALANAGFREIAQYDSKDFGDDSPVIFICRKP